MDGGICDNHGIRELLDQDCTAIVVSDAGGQMSTVHRLLNHPVGVLPRTTSMRQARGRTAGYWGVESRYIHWVNSEVHHTWVLKSEFNQFWDYKTRRSTKYFLQRWMTTALKSRLQPLRKFIATLGEHTVNILTFIDSRLTNAISEGLNRIIRIVRKRTNGFRTVQAFLGLIYLTVCDVDIPAQIPNEFYTLQEKYLTQPE